MPADYLTRRGLAVLRFDERGVGESTGDFANATTLDFASDVLAAVRYLRSRKEIDPKRIGVIGHSEGGIIAPLVAKEDKKVAFIVLIAGPGVPGDELLRVQDSLILLSQGTPAEELPKLLAMHDRMLKLAKSDLPDSVVTEQMEAALKEARADWREEDWETLGLSDLMIKATVQKMSSKWLRYFLRHDPRPVLAKVKCPVLAVNGTLDLQVEPLQNLGAIQATLKNAGHKHFEIIELDGLNHLLQTAKTGAITEYGRIEETMAPAALETIADWILRVVSQKK